MLMRKRKFITNYKAEIEQPKNNAELKRNSNIQLQKDLWVRQLPTSKYSVW